MFGYSEVCVFSVKRLLIVKVIFVFRKFLKIELVLEVY